MANEQNLIPAKKGEIRNPLGKPKGTLNFSSRVKKLVGDPKLAEKLLKLKPGWWNDLDDKDMANAIICAMMIQAASGDVKAAEFIRKSGWGDKLDITSDNKPIPLLGGIVDFPKDDSTQEDSPDED